jgi:AcrR family transcriptional regulator
MMVEASDDEPRGRERMLAASAELFRQKTVAGTSLRMIAERAGVTAPALYHHFKSRDDIILAVHRPLADDVDKVIEQLWSLPREDRRSEARNLAVDLIVRHRGLMRVLFDQGALNPESAARIDAQNARLAGFIAGSDDPDAIAEAEALLFGAAAVTLRRPELDADALHRIVSRVMGLHGE